MASGGGVRWRKALNDDSIRLVTGKPRRIPRRKREEIATILAQELLDTRTVVDATRHAARYGAFHVLLRSLKDTPEWGRLREMAAKSDIISVLALRSVTQVVLDILDRSIPLPAESAGEKSLNGLVALTMIAWQQRTSVGRSELARGVEEFEIADSRGEALASLREVIHASLASVVEEMDRYMQMLSMMKQMLPSGDDEAFVEEVFMAYLENVGRLKELMDRSKELQRIIDIMGKLDVEYGAKQEKAQHFITSEAYSLSLSKDVHHVLPVELIKLKVPILRVLFFSQMIEGELLTYELRNQDWNAEPENRKKGPVVALIDASGSMSGEPELFAKAFILMLAKRMEREQRDVKIILFAAADWKLDLNLHDKMKVAQTLLDTICRHFEGYTDFNSALRVGLDTVKGKQWKGADVLFFTDGESKVSDEDLVREWNDFKRRTKSKIYTLIVSGDQAGGLERVSDRVWTLPTGTWEVEGSPSGLIRLIAQGQKA